MKYCPSKSRIVLFFETLYLEAVQKRFPNLIIPFRFQRITRRQGGGSAGVFVILRGSRRSRIRGTGSTNKVSRRKRKGMIHPLTLTGSIHILRL